MRRIVLTCVATVIIAGSAAAPAIAKVTKVVPKDEGSSDPTYFASQHRIAVTQGGRLLVVHGRHKRGVQLRWKNKGSTIWREGSKGAVSDGMLLDDTGSGDWPSSIVVGTGADGKERAWVLIGDVNFTNPQPVRMRVLSRLDASGGPTVGPMVIVDNAARGDAFVDVALERQPGGGLRGAVAFVRRIDDNTWRLIVKWFTNLQTNTPGFTGAHGILSSTSGRKQSTLVRTTYGMALMVRAEKGEIVMFTHKRKQRLTRWHRTGAGVSAVALGKPSATGLANGDVLMAIEDRVAANHVTVQRFSPDGRVRTVLRMTGVSMPSIASQRRDAWLVMVRDSDGFVVSRHFNPISGWSPIRVEIGNSDHHKWPNTLRTSQGFLRFVVRAGAVGTTRSGVKAVERPARPGPD